MKKTFLLADDDFDDLELFAEAMRAVAPDITLVQVVNGLQVLEVLETLREPAAPSAAKPTAKSTAPQAAARPIDTTTTPATAPSAEPTTADPAALSAAESQIAEPAAKSAAPQAAARPDLIVLDLNMPECNGIECLRALKASPATSDIPVVIYTTSSNQSEAGEALRLGAEGLIIKPSHFEDLRKIIALLATGLDGDLRAAIKTIQKITR